MTARRAGGTPGGSPARVAGSGAVSERKTTQSTGSLLEDILLNRLERAGLPKPEQQQALVLGRKFAFDFVYRAEKLAIEVQGGIWSNGAHARGSGIERDCLKISAVVAMGWRVMPVTRRMIEDGTATALIAQALGMETT